MNSNAICVHSSTYNISHEKYDDLLDGHANLSVIFKCLPRRVSTLCKYYFHIDRFYCKITNPLLRKDDRPWPHEPDTQFVVHIGPGPKDHNLTTRVIDRHIKAIISCHRRCFPRFGDLSFLDSPMREIFQIQKLQYIWLENLTCTNNKIL